MMRKALKMDSNLRSSGRRAAVALLALSIISSDCARVFAAKGAVGEVSMGGPEAISHMLMDDTLLRREFASQVDQLVPGYSPTDLINTEAAGSDVTAQMSERAALRTIRSLLVKRPEDQNWDYINQIAQPGGDRREIIDAISARGQEFQRQTAQLLAAENQNAGLESVPPTVSKMYEHLALQLIRLMVARPEMLPPDGKGRKGMNKALIEAKISPEKLDLLRLMAMSFQEEAAKDPQAALSRDLMAAQSEFDLNAGAGSPEAMRAMLEQYIDGAKKVVRGGDAAVEQAPVLAQAPVAVAPPVAAMLKKPEARPLMDAAALKEYLEKRREITEIDESLHNVAGVLTVYFDPGDFDQRYMPMLEEMEFDKFDEHGNKNGTVKADVVEIRGKVSPDEIATFKQLGGHLTAKRTVSVHPTMHPNDYLKKQGQGVFNDIMLSRHVPVTVSRLTQGLWDRFYQLYEKVIKGRKHGTGHLYAKSEGGDEVRNGKGWTISYFDPEGEKVDQGGIKLDDGRVMVGGVTAEEYKMAAGRMLWLHYAAYRDVTKPWAIAQRTLLEGLNIAFWRDIPYTSLGLDNTWLGFYDGTGVFVNKTAFGMTFYLAADFVLRKFLRTDKFRLEKRDGKYDGLIGFMAGVELERRYVESWLAGAPKKAHELIGDFFELPADQAIQMYHYYIDPTVQIRSPKGMGPQIREPLDTLK